MSAPIWMLVVLLAAGCGAGDDGPAPTEFGGDRPAALQVPSTYDADRAYPLVLVLHGLGVTGFVQQAYFGFAGAADARDALILAPDGTVDSGGTAFWNGSEACCDFDGSGVDDVAYLGGLIDDVSAAYNVDPARVFVIGHSNGGLMSYRMACERADVVAAIISLAGAAAYLDAEACVPERPVSVLSLHGDADQTVPYAGGITSVEGAGPVIGAVESVERWAAYDGCGGLEPADGSLDVTGNVPGAETTIQIAAGCPETIGVELWTLHGADHIPSLRAPETPDALWAWLGAHSRE